MSVWFSLQHDGIVIGRKENTNPYQFVSTLPKYVSNALGYNQKVEVKKMETKWATPASWVWDHTPCKPEVSIEVRDSENTRKFNEWMNRVTQDGVSKQYVHTYNSIALLPITSNQEARRESIRRWEARTKIYNSNKEVWEKKLWDTQMGLRREYLNLEGDNHPPLLLYDAPAAFQPALSTLVSTYERICPHIYVIHIFLYISSADI